MNRFNAMQTQGSFPWVIPFGSPSQGVADFRFLIDHTPAGARGWLRAGADGHYYLGNKRIRFWGVNITAGACFPSQADAVKMADQIAQTGFNIVRFHHMDAFWSQPSVIDYGAGGSRRFNTNALARFDYLFAQLRERGVYANINLLVNRRFYAADGLPSEIEQVQDVKAQHAIGFFYRPLIELQKEFARQLLTHRNPHTGRAYAEDPAVAMVEINNENGLIQGWMSGFLDDAPAVFQNDLQRQWNEWLQRKYSTTDALRRAWGERSEPLGAQMFQNPRFTQGLEYWVLEQHGEGRATGSTQPGGPNGSNIARIQITQTSPTFWHVQFNQTGLRFEAERLYTLRFYARASQRRTLGVNIGQAYEPWAQLGFERRFEVDTEWREYRFSFVLPRSDNNARLNFDRLPELAGEVFFADMWLSTGGELRFLPDGDVLGERRVPIIRHRERNDAPPAAQRDWHEFLWDTERAYWREMANYIKRDLGYKGVVFGTIIGCSTPHLMAQLDSVDGHAYWMHPEFPGAAWDSNNWFVRNEPMINSDETTLHRLALQRVVGKPFTVTEYDHPAPNQYAAEGALMLAAHGALQDWDGLFLFDYGAASGEGRINSYFEQRTHPVKWGLARACAALFVRGDVRPAQKLLCAALTRDEELDALRQVWAWGLPDGRFARLDGRAITLHRVALALEPNQVPSGALRPRDVSVSGAQRTSDTGELVWNRGQAGRCFLLVKSRLSKAAVGYIGGRTLDLGDKVSLEVLSAPLNGFGVVAITVLQEKPVWRALITAISTAENTGWNFRDLGDNRVTVGNQWGSPPTRIAVPELMLSLPYAASRVKCWALSENGARAREVAVVPQGSDRAALELGAKHRTLWYEVEARL
ncbi:MAG: carbohydrate binding domain-containing protein [Fimbriimonadales bacterium]|nr:carbohydrate binding domain-containing protein [Fimbriimonadales bacterium]